MAKKKEAKKLIKVVDEAIKISNRAENGILKILVNTDTQGELGRYSFAYINERFFREDNGRMLGYDNCHGHHHRHYMGKEEAIKFESYAALARRFEKEWRELHEQIKQGQKISRR